MTVSLIPAVLAVLLGLLASGAIDFLDSEETHPVAWAAFALALALVVRDSLLGGSFLPGGGSGWGGRRRPGLPGLEVRGGDVRIRVFDLEPVATTLAILLGLLVTQAIDFLGADGGTTAWGWAVFALSLVLATGARLRPRPRRQPQRRAWEHVAEEVQTRVEGVLNDIANELRGKDERPD